MLKIIALLAAVGSGMEVELELLGKYNECLANHAVELDDGISEAATIGAAVARSCEKNLFAYISAITAGMPAVDVMAAFESAKLQSVNDGIDAVLRARATKRQALPR